MPRQRLPVQYFADILGELKDANAKLDQLISQQVPAEVSEPAGSEPAPVRLEEPVRPDEVETRLQVGERVLSRDKVSEMVNDPEGYFSDAREQAEKEVTCQETTKRGNTCGRSLPCLYHG